jgi:hypothetical protein
MDRSKLIPFDGVEAGYFNSEIRLNAIDLVIMYHGIIICPVPPCEH